MALRLIRPILGGKLKNLLVRQANPIVNSSARNYVSEMRKWAFEGNILRLLRNEIQYEYDRSPPSQPIPQYDAFMVDEKAGEQWIRLSRKFGENEEIKVEVTMFDGSVPLNKSGYVASEDDVQLHITLIIHIFKGENGDVLEFVCSAWPDSIEIRNVFTRRHDAQAQPYMGPKFKELDDELQDALYDFLEERGINDELAAFLHKYMRGKDKREYIRFIESVKSFVEKK